MKLFQFQIVFFLKDSLFKKHLVLNSADVITGFPLMRKDCTSKYSKTLSLESGWSLLLCAPFSIKKIQT